MRPYSQCNKAGASQMCTHIKQYIFWSIYARNYFPKDTPVDYIPEISYAFFDVNQNGDISSQDSYALEEKRFTSPSQGVQPLDSWNDNSQPYYGILGQFRKLKQQGKNFTLTLAIGGWTYSKYFSQAVGPNSRQNFVKSIIKTLKKYQIFDGVTFDWEYLSNDGVNYGNTGNTATKSDVINFEAFLKLLRQQLSANGLGDTTVAFCVTPAPEKIKFNPSNLNKYIDEFHVMTYDFHDGKFGETVTAHQSNLNPVQYANYSVKSATESYISKGVPSNKIFIGAVTYSRGFSNTLGLAKKAQGGSQDTSWEQGICDYKNLPRQGKRCSESDIYQVIYAGAKEYYDQQAGAAFSYDSSKKIFNSYDNPQSIAAKAQYVKDKNLGGIIVWEMSGDYPFNNSKSIARALNTYLN